MLEFIGVLGVFLFVGRLIQQIISYKKKFHTEEDYFFSHIFDDTNIQEEYSKHEEQNKQNFILSTLEIQFPKNNKYKL